mmetsp:Transcript_40447/g.90811  ORF Transcript_40447/g.90811 Transcript_40447/m.90811 type:complete len:238 (-) Transcript_40447:111-824(-)
MRPAFPRLAPGEAPPHTTTAEAPHMSPSAIISMLHAACQARCPGRRPSPALEGGRSSCTWGASRPLPFLPAGGAIEREPRWGLYLISSRNLSYSCCQTARYLGLLGSSESPVSLSRSLSAFSRAVFFAAAISSGVKLGVGTHGVASRSCCHSTTPCCTTDAAYRSLSVAAGHVCCPPNRYTVPRSRVAVQPILGVGTSPSTSSSSGGNQAPAAQSNTACRISWEGARVWSCEAPPKR